MRGRQFGARAIAALAAGGGCGGDASPHLVECPTAGEEAPISQATMGRAAVGTPGPLRWQWQLCEASGGAWHHILTSCSCPDSLFFSLEDGCRPLSAADGVGEALCQELGAKRSPPHPAPVAGGGAVQSVLRRDSGRIRIDIACSELDAGQLAIARAARPSALLRGLTLPRDDRGVLVGLKIGRGREQAPQPRQSHAYGKIWLDTLKPTTFFNDLGSRARRAHVCDGLDAPVRRLLHRLRRDDLMSSPFFVQDHPDCRRGCQINRSIDGEDRGIQAYLTTLMADFAPISRELEVFTEAGRHWKVALTPEGEVVKAEVSWSTAAEENDLAGYRCARDIDADGQEAPRRATPLPRSLIGEASSSVGRDARARVVAIAVEESWNLDRPHLRNLVDFSSARHPPAAQDTWSWPAHSGGSRQDDVAALLSAERTGHGVLTLAALAAGTRSARFRLMTYDSLARKEPGQAIDAWRDYIASSGARVVNISAVLGEGPMPFDRCEALFHAIVDALPHVVFLAGAGNSGGAATYACPAALLRHKANGVSVAGASADKKHIASGSSHGADFVDVAAPMTNVALSLGGLPDESTIYSGSSHATAWTSNLVVRLLEEQPGLTPHAIKARLYRSCRRLSGQPLDVACGGTIDPDVFLSPVTQPAPENPIFVGRQTP